MPGSSPVGKLAISRWYDALPESPKHLLDIGPGWGTFAKLFRKPGQSWDAVEIHGPYVKTFRLDKLYDRVFVQDAAKFKPSKAYDLAFLGDVLEHVVFDDAHRLLENLLHHCRYVIISIPLDAETGASLENAQDYWHNVHERHLHRWDNRSVMEMIRRSGGEIMAMEKYSMIAAYLVGGTARHRFIRDRRPTMRALIYGSFTRKYDYDPRRTQVFVQRRILEPILAVGGKVTPELIKKPLRSLIKLRH